MAKQAKKVTKPKALKPIEHKRTAKEESSLAEAVRKQAHDNAVLHKVWKGDLPKKALLKKENGGESHSQGMGDVAALREFGPRAIAHGKSAHDKLFTRMVEEKSRGGGAKPVGRPKGAATRGKAGLEDFAGKSVKILVDSNPKRGKAAERFALYKNGMSVDEFVKLGGTVADVRWDMGKGFIKLV